MLIQKLEPISKSVDYSAVTLGYALKLHESSQDLRRLPASVVRTDSDPHQLGPVIPESCGKDYRRLLNQRGLVPQLITFLARDTNPQTDTEASRYLKEYYCHTQPQASTQSQEKRALLKLDLLLIPILGLFFFLSFLDRSNLAKNLMVATTHLSPPPFPNELKTLHSSLIELPSNLLVRKIGAGRLIPMIVATWGLVTCLQGLVTSYRGLLVARFFLGLVEGGLYPAIVLYLSTFYTRTELQFRIALFWGTICISGAASGLLTYAIIELHGRWGHPGWAWVFLIEGFVTVICGVIGFFILPSSIEKVKILTEAEKALLRSRLEAASSTGSNVFSSDISSQHYPNKSTMLQVWEACISPHVFFLNIAQFACAGNINSLAYFTPTIVNSFGYSPSTTQLFSVPPFAVAFVFVLGLSYWSDRRQARGLACGISSVIAITGFAVFYASGHDKVRYGSLFLSVPGAYGASPSLSAWTADNSAPHMRKATALALGTMVANSGGLFCVWASLLLSFSVRQITGSDLKAFFYAASIIWWCLDLHIGA
ncbi:uncharacterized protein PGTG_07046 [Puccinia graminis f. sp. tritici CRL 75-36-700-3]|uniref:Major facilitator superfamily (MFS) profile domain-containing protein n=1 Tax=Puccinia graminis f. sp. tritici (strain CRL 75-36-700-3 / race SCCL) TaxID=418459 RepID=E3KAL3_PUCGT|nr:uncharacterized protein PGTG_07046 [Puccinia graminis f. sp. tritici CRL 75-36-700-3]EFP81425.2 hypothetical protein PGTG_07046 [Puccinia graminis f. sp. tritici CRL 75-36-700-3]